MISVCIASCLNKPERLEYLNNTISNLRSVLGEDIEILIGFDKYGEEIEGTKCLTHNKGLGHSWNWGIENASNDLILQIEDDWIIELGGNNQENLPDKESFFYNLDNRIEIVKKFGGIFKFTSMDNMFWSAGKTEREFGDYKFKELNRTPQYRPNTWDMYIYSNQPHLKKRDFHKTVGYYQEGVPVPNVEIDMCEKVFHSGEKVFMSDFFTFVHTGFVPSRPNSSTPPKEDG